MHAHLCPVAHLGWWIFYRENILKEGFIKKMLDSDDPKDWHGVPLFPGPPCSLPCALFRFTCFFSFFFIIFSLLCMLTISIHIAIAASHAPTTQGNSKATETLAGYFRMDRKDSSNLLDRVKKEKGIIHDGHQTSHGRKGIAAHMTEGIQGIGGLDREQVESFANWFEDQHTVDKCEREPPSVSAVSHVPLRSSA